MQRIARSSRARRVLIAGRSVLARLIGAAVARFSRLEQAFVRIGRALASRSYMLSTLYFSAHQDLVRRLRESGLVYREMRIGPLTLQLDITDHSAIHQYFYGPDREYRYEPQLTDFLLTELRPGDVFVDIGANIGFFSLIAATLVQPTGRVIAFEPHPDTCDAMRCLLRVNGLSNLVEIVPAAISDGAEHEGLLYLTSDPVISTLDPGLTPMRHDFTFDRSIRVAVTTLDDWMATNSALERRVVMVKVDVEGVEDRAVAGMTRVLTASSGVRVICETSIGSRADQRLQSLGFTRRPMDLYDPANSFGNFLYQRAPRS